MQKNHRRTIGGPSFSVSDIQDAGIDLLQWPNDVFVPGLIAGTFAGLALLDCAAAEPIMPSSAAGNRHYSDGKKSATIVVDLFDHFSTSE